MTEPSEPSELSSERGLDRLITFLDAVVAIAITLLVLPLVDLAGEARDAESLGEVMKGHGFDLFAFLLSFYVISQLWRGHHSITQDLKVHDGALLRLNLLWVLAIAFLPFPTALLGPIGNQKPVELLYIGTILAGNVCLMLMVRHIGRTPELVLDGVTAHSWHASTARTLILVLALLLALFVPAVNYWAMLLLLATGQLAGLLRRLRP